MLQPTSAADIETLQQRYGGDIERSCTQPGVEQASWRSAGDRRGLLGKLGMNVDSYASKQSIVRFWDDSRDYDATLYEANIDGVRRIVVHHRHAGVDLQLTYCPITLKLTGLYGSAETEIRTDNGHSGRDRRFELRAAFDEDGDVELHFRDMIEPTTDSVNALWRVVRGESSYESEWRRLNNASGDNAPVTYPVGSADGWRGASIVSTFHGLVGDTWHTGRLRIAAVMMQLLDWLSNELDCRIPDISDILTNRNVFSMKWSCSGTMQTVEYGSGTCCYGEVLTLKSEPLSGERYLERCTELPKSSRTTSRTLYRLPDGVSMSEIGVIVNRSTDWLAKRMDLLGAVMVARISASEYLPGAAPKRHYTMRNRTKLKLADRTVLTTIHIDAPGYGSGTVSSGCLYIDNSNSDAATTIPANSPVDYLLHEIFNTDCIDSTYIGANAVAEILASGFHFKFSGATRKAQSGAALVERSTDRVLFEFDEIDEMISDLTLLCLDARGRERCVKLVHVAENDNEVVLSVDGLVWFEMRKIVFDSENDLEERKESDPEPQQHGGVRVTITARGKPLITAAFAASTSGPDTVEFIDSGSALAGMDHAQLLSEIHRTLVSPGSQFLTTLDRYNYAAYDFLTASREYISEHTILENLCTALTALGEFRPLPQLRLLDGLRIVAIPLMQSDVEGARAYSKLQAVDQISDARGLIQTPARQPGDAPYTFGHGDDSYRLTSPDGSLHFNVVEHVEGATWKQSITGVSSTPEVTTFGGNGSKTGGAGSSKKSGSGAGASSSTSAVGSSINHINIPSGKPTLNADIDKFNRLKLKLGDRLSRWLYQPCIYKAAFYLDAANLPRPCVIKLELFEDSKVASHERLDKVRVSKCRVAWIRRVQVDCGGGDQRGNQKQASMFYSDKLQHQICALCDDNFADMRGTAAQGVQQCEHRYCRACISRIMVEGNRCCPECRRAWVGMHRVVRPEQAKDGLYAIRTAYSIYFDRGYPYHLGQEIEIPDFNPNLNDPCSTGSHGFLKHDDPEMIIYFGFLLDPQYLNRIGPHDNRTPLETMQYYAAVEESERAARAAMHLQRERELRARAEADDDDDEEQKEGDVRFPVPSAPPAEEGEVDNEMSAVDRISQVLRASDIALSDEVSRIEPGDGVGYDNEPEVSVSVRDMVMSSEKLSLVAMAENDGEDLSDESSMQLPNQPQPVYSEAVSSSAAPASAPIRLRAAAVSFVPSTELVGLRARSPAPPGGISADAVDDFEAYANAQEAQSSYKSKMQ
jgi:hypothetical protein